MQDDFHSKTTPSCFLFIVAVVLCSNVATQGQGALAFATRNAAPNVDVTVVDGRTGVALAGDSWRAQLYYSQDLSAAASLRPANPATSFMSGVGAGYVIPQILILSDVAPGNTVALEMRVWNADSGPDYESALRNPTGVVGRSDRFLLDTSESVTSPAYLIGLRSFSVYGVPEPSAWLLFAFGCLGISWFRKTSHL